MASARVSEKRVRRHTHHILILLLALQPRPIVGTVHLDEIEPLHRTGGPVRQVLRQQRAEIWNLPKAVDLAHTEIATPSEHTDAKLPQVDDADLSFVRRAP